MSENPRFWAKALLEIYRRQAAEKGVPDDLVAQTMMIEAWTILTGCSEADARAAIERIIIKEAVTAAELADAKAQGFL